MPRLNMGISDHLVTGPVLLSPHLRHGLYGGISFNVRNAHHELNGCLFTLTQKLHRA